VISRKSAAPGAAVFALALLSGCSFGWLPWGHKEPAEACPAAIALQPLKNTVVFAAGANPAPQSVAFYGIIDEVDSKCEYRNGAVQLKLAVVVIGERGPAVGGSAVDFNYFVAVTGPGQSILAKTPFRVHIVFPPDKKRAGVTDHIEETIPLQGERGSELTVNVGFQQSPEVVDFYRHFRGRL
jgi:hypothetical protein